LIFPIMGWAMATAKWDVIRSTTEIES